MLTPRQADGETQERRSTRIPQGSQEAQRPGPQRHPNKAAPPGGDGRPEPTKDKLSRTPVTRLQ